MDTQMAAVAARGLYDIPCADRKALGKVTREPIHDELPQTPWNQAPILIPDTGSSARRQKR